MSRFNTGNPLDSDRLEDLSDNAKNVDLFSNDTKNKSYTDRFGKKRRTIHSMESDFDADQKYRSDKFSGDQIDRESKFIASQKDKQDRFNDFIASSGYQFIGDYAAGVELTEYNQIVRDADGEFWRVSGKTELPYTLTGSGVDENSALVSVGDATLRQDLVNPDKGAAMVARGVVAVDSIAELLTLDPTLRSSDKEFVVKGFHPPQNILANPYSGGNRFYWDPTRSKSSHDGGRVIDPNKSFPEDWGDPLQVAEWFEPPINGAGVFVAIDKRASPVITVEEFGAMAGTDIDHAPVFAAIYRSNVNRSTVIFSRGVYKTSAPFTVRDGSSVEGVGRSETIIEGLGGGVTCIRLQNAGTGRTFDCRVTNIGATNPLTFTGITDDFRGASYCRFEGVSASISGGAGSSAGLTAWADAIGIDLTRGGASFNGYNSVIGCYASYHRIGLLAHVHDCKIDLGAFNRNGQLGIDIIGGAAYSIQGAEVSGNGTENDPDNHGGVRFVGRGLFCSGVWNEYNRNKLSGTYSPNNWITKDGRDVFILPGRDDSGDSNYVARGFEGDKGVLRFGQPAIADTSTTGMIRNGNLAIRGPDNTPLGWSVAGDATFNTDSGEQGEFGYSGGVIFDHVSGVASRVHQLVLSPAEVAKLKGQTIRVTWVFKIPVGVNLTNSANRIGLWFAKTSAFTNGSLVSLSPFPEGEVVQYTASLEINDAMAADPVSIRATIQLDEGSVIVYGCSVTLGQAAYLNFNAPVTDAGGVVYGPLDLSGTLVLKTYADNAAAVAAGLGSGRPYKTASGELRIVV